MTDLFKNKYRIKSARAEWWNYGSNAAYFITICTAGRNHYFGEIAAGKMQLSQVGVIADILWHEIPNHSSFVELGEFIVMPNHIHGILILDKPDDVADDYIIDDTDNPEPEPESQPRPERDSQPDSHPSPNQQNPIKNSHMAEISPKQDSISTIVRSYKSAVTKHARRLGFDFAWQSRFHDHIIRDRKSFDNISAYIMKNVANWREDRFFRSILIKRDQLPILY